MARTASQCLKALPRLRRDARIFTIYRSPSLSAPLRATPPRTSPSTASHSFTTSSSQHASPPSFAFAFDIDGVLLRSSTPIPGARESLSYLQQHSIPFILLTNGGGKKEHTRVDEINTKLSLQTSHRIHHSQIVQSHTPFRELAIGPESYRDKTVLVLGGDADRCRDVAHSYGFRNVVTPADIYLEYPSIWPFSKNFKRYYGTFGQPLPRPINPQAGEDATLKIDAVFVFNDPRDWGLDCQLLVDVMLSSRGVLGTYSKNNGDKSLPNRGFQQDGQPPIHFSNPDLLWASEYPLSRLGQGGFREAVNGVWRAVTKTMGGEAVDMKYEILGKPHQKTYEFAEKVLVEQRGKVDEGLKKVYMIGDNPESDIMGANNFKSEIGAEWKSVLTKTGVFRAREGEEPSVKPDVIVADVREGVRWALKDSGWDGTVD